MQKPCSILVSLPVFLYLFDPIFAIVDWHTITACALVTMPEAAVDEDNFLSAAENEVRATWQILSMEPVSIALRIQ